MAMIETDDADQVSRQRSGWVTALDIRVLALFALGISAGLPIFLIFSTLSVWLKEAGIEKSSITFFSWAALGYGFKFIWAPIIDRMPLPRLTGVLGRRRSWLWIAQIAVALSITGMAFSDPVDSAVMIAIFAVCLGFSSASQDIVIDAYRIEIAPPDLQAMLSAAYIAGYRVALIIAGAGSLFIAASISDFATAGYNYSSWQIAYLTMALLMVACMAITFLVKEPLREPADEVSHPPSEHISLLVMFLICAAVFACVFFFVGIGLNQPKKVFTEFFSNRALAGFLIETLRLAVSLGAAGLVGWALVFAGFVNRAMARASFIAPVESFFTRFGVGALVLLLLISTYRMTDIVMGSVANIFYLDVGFDKADIAAASKTFGLIITIAGGFVGGLLSTRFTLMPIMILGVILAAASNLLFAMLAVLYGNLDLLLLWEGGLEPIFQLFNAELTEKQGLLVFLYATIGVDNLSQGIASAAFVAYLSVLTDRKVTASQFAILTSIVVLLPKIIAGYSGTMAESLGYPWFFSMTTLIGVPVVFFCIWAQKVAPVGRFEFAKG